MKKLTGNTKTWQVVRWWRCVGWGLLYASKDYIRLPKIASEHFFLQGITLILIADKTPGHLLGEKPPYPTPRLRLPQ